MRIAVIAEAEADSRLVRDLVDRKILHHQPTTPEQEPLEKRRKWCGLVEGTQFTRTRELKKMEVSSTVFRRPRALGFSKQGNLHYDYSTLRKAIILCTVHDSPPDALVFIRDLDQQVPERSASIRQAREEAGGGLLVLLALPNTKREAWALNGFVAVGKDEKKRYETIKAELGFCPCEKSEKLTASTKGAKRDAKRVLDYLIDGDSAREEKCWLETDWQVLLQRGKGSGLTTFLEEVRSLLIPKITG